MIDEGRGEMGQAKTRNQARSGSLVNALYTRQYHNTEKKVVVVELSEWDPKAFARCLAQFFLRKWKSSTFVQTVIPLPLHCICSLLFLTIL